MLWFIASLAFIGDLTETNFSEFISAEQQFPAFVLLKSQWCHHCAALAPDWDQLREFYSNDSRVLIADISYDTDRELCDRFPQDGTPRIFWVAAGLDSAEQYLNPYHFESFLSFVNEKLSDPVAYLQNHSDFITIQQFFPHQSLFFIQEPNSNTTEAFLANLSTTLRGTAVRFFKLNYTEFAQSEPKFIYRWPLMNYTIEYRELFNDTAALEAFVRANAYPPMNNATAIFVNAMMHRDYVLYLYQGVDVSFDDNITELATEFPPDLKGGILDCVQTDKLCRLLGINRLYGTQLVLARPPKNVYYKFDGTFSNDNVRSWLKSALRGWQKAYGPGAGLKGIWFNFKVRMANAEARNQFILTAGTAAAIVVGLFAIVLLRRWGRKVGAGEAKRKDRPTETQLDRERDAMIDEMARQERVFAKRKHE
jgi:thiol-disulfide isomerase/thioredoxin